MGKKDNKKDNVITSDDINKVKDLADQLDFLADFADKVQSGEFSSS